MRKLKFAVLFVLVLCLTVGILVACDQTGNSGVPTIPTNPDGSQSHDSYTTMSGADAWALFKDAASAANAPTGNYVYADSVIYLDYIKDATGWLYAVKVQADIDLENDVNSELLLELWQADGEGNLAKMLIGLYYYDSTLVYDCTGLKEGAKVVKTDNINLTAIEATLREMFNGSSLANFLLNNLLTFDTGVVGTVEGLVTALLGDSRLITNSDGTQRLEMPLSLSSIIGSLLSGVLVPGPDGLISDDIAELIYDVLGIDLYMFEALVPENVSVYLIADLKDGADGGKVLSGMSVDVGVDFNTYDTSLEEDYGIIESSVDLSIGASTIDKLTAPTLDVVGYLTAPKAAEGELESAGGRGIESIENLDDYSILDIDLTLSLGVALNACSISANEIMGAFGSLITGLIPEGSITEDIQQILDKKINIEEALHELNIHISGGIDMFDNAGTNLLIEITGADVYNDVRASIGYVGADDALYIDLSGILGTGKFVIDEIDLNGVLSDLIQNELIPLVKDGLASVGLLPDAAGDTEEDDVPPATEEQQEAFETVGELIENGSVLQVYGGSASGEPITDVIGLVKAIFANIDVDMAQNIFNIQAITVTLTQEILDYIWSLAFTGDLEGATIPIVGDVVLEYRNNGFATTKDIELGVNLGNVLTGDVIAGLTVGIEAQFGSVINDDYFNSRLAAFSAGRQNGEYITLASFGDLFDEQGNFSLDINTLLAGIQSVGIGLQADINISALEGGLADIYYEQANEFLIAVLAEFEQSFGASATLVLQAEVTDVSALISALSVPEGETVDIGALLSALNVYVALEAADGSAPLRVWFTDGVLYLATSEELLGGLALQVDIKPFLASAGGAGEALSADETGSGGADEGSAVTIPAELLAIIAAADITVGDLYIDVALGSGLLATLLNLIGVTGIEINESGSDETLGLDAGISIELNDGLQIAGDDTSEGLSVGIVLGVGDNFDFTVDLGGVNAVVNGESYIEPVPEDVEFVDFFNEPYVNLSLEFGLKALIAGGSVSLGDDVGSIDFPEGLDVDLTLSLNANLDLGTLLAGFTGVAPEGENRTELALQLKNGEEVLLAVYYADGTLYVDASTLIGARVSTDLDIMALLASVIAGAGSGGEAGTTADINAEDYSVGVFEFLMKVTSAGFSIEVAQGLTSVINDLIGMNLGEINAALSLDWTNIVKDEDGGYLLDANVSIGDTAEVGISLSGLGLGIGAGIFEESVLPTEFNAEAYKNIGSLLDENNQFSAEGLELDSVYVELSGTLDLSADADNADDWNVGDWINNFLEGNATVADNVKSLIQKLVLSFAIDRSVSTSLEFTLKALLRFGDLSSENLVAEILSNSDIALEIRESGKAENLLAVYIIANEDTGKSTLYISSDAGGLIGGGIAMPDIDLGALFATTDTPAEGEGTQSQALSAADGDGTETAGDADNILDTILGVINRIYMTDSELEIGFGANFLVSLLNMLLPGYELNADNFVQLNPENSFLSLFYGLGEGGRREIGIDLSLGVDPFTVELGLGGLKVAINDDGYAIKPSVPEDYESVDDYYKNIFAEDGVISLEATVGLELAFGNTAELEDGKLPIGDMLSAIIGNLALELGVEIADDLSLAVDVYLGANIRFGDAENTEIALEIRDALSGDVIIAVYLRGSAMYVDMGKLSDKDFVIENTGIISTVIEMVSELLAGTGNNDGTGASEAVTASDAAAQADGEDMLDIVFEIAEGHLALNVTERVLLGIIGAVAGTDVDIASIFEALNLGAEVSVDVDFEAPSVSIDIDTNYASVGISIKDPYITNSESGNVSGTIDKAIANGNFQSYEASSVARFGLNLSVRYNADATYQQVDNPEDYANSDRYSQLPDGSFVQDNDGDYVRRAVTLSEIIDALLDMPAIADALGNVGDETLQAMVDVLVARLGIELYLDDPIGDNLQINIEGLLDLEALGLSGILGDFTIPEFDTLAILNALQVGIEIIFNPETGGAADVGIYLMNGDIYVDLSGLGGPKISARLFDILAEMNVGPFGSGDGTEAVTADENSGDGSESSSDGVDVNALLNALVRTIVLRQGGFAMAGEDGYYNILQSGVGLDLMLPSNLVGNIVSLIVGNGEEYSFDDFILNEEQSRISLVIGGGNLAIEVAAQSDTGFSVEVATEAGIVIDIATQDDTLLSSRERSTYVDMTDLVLNIIDLINGETADGGGFGSQRVTLSMSGMARFESEGEGSYDLGSLLAQYLGDIVLELNTRETFSDGIAFRLSVAADLGAIDFASLTGETPDWDAFLENTDLDTIEVALELLNIDAAGNIEQDNVLGGVYISRGRLYLDGTGIFDVVENYSYVPNFLRFVIEAAELGASADVATGGSTEASSQALTAAVTASEGGTAARDALLELIYSDTAMQIVLTKSVISAVLATLVPDLGGIADIFDNFDVTLGAEIGRIDYVSVYDVFYSAAENEDGGYVAVMKDGSIIGFRPATADDADAQKYSLTRIDSEDTLDGTYYVAEADGTFTAAADGHRYSYYDTETYVLAGDGVTGSFVKLVALDTDDREIYLEADRYVFYTPAGGGTYTVVSSLDDVDGDSVYVIYDGMYRQLEYTGEGATAELNTYVRQFGYVRDAEGDLYRVYTPHTAISDFYLTLGAHVGTMNVGLELGGIQIGFGGSDSLVPDYVTEGKTKTPAVYDGTQGKAYTYDENTGVYTAVESPLTGEEYYYDVSLAPFYDSVITVGMSLEFELSVTEGKIDVGQIFADILGDLDGVVIEIPETNKGYSSAHLRLDISLMLDMQDLPGSEMAVELYNLSSETGAEVKWLAAYYLDGMLYIDLSFFNMPKLAVPMTEISDFIDDMLGDLLDTSVYDDVEVSGGSSSEAITADDTAGKDGGKADLTTEEKVASLLISERRLALSVGNAFLRYLLENITIGDDPLGSLVYEDLLGGLDVVIDVSDGLDVSLDLALALTGDRYILVDGGAGEETDEVRYYVFVGSTDGDAAGLFVYDNEEEVYRAANKQDIAAGMQTYARYEAENADGEWVYYTYTQVDGTPAEGTTYYRYDEAQDAYAEVGADEDTEGVILYTRDGGTSADGLAVYAYAAGTSANPNDYDTELDLHIGINNVDMYFTEQREYSLTAEELKEYYNFNSVDTVSLSETISLDLLFDVGSEIDLAGLFEYLFPDSTYDFDTIIEAVGEGAQADEILRGLELTVSLEFKLGAFINYLRSLDARYELGSLDENGVFTALAELPDQLDLVTFIELIMSLVGAKAVPNADGSIYYTDDTVDDLFGLEDFLNFVNASVVLGTSSNDGTVDHAMLGVYLSLGDEEGVAYDENEHEGQQRYSHYFASALGDYGYADGEYVLISEIEGYDEAVHGRYSYDSSFLYPDENGNLVRESAGLYVDLTYFGQPGVYVNLSELMDFIGGMMGTELSLGGGASEAITAAEGDGSVFPVDLGDILGGGINLSDSLPLLSQEIAAYIQAFLYGVRITSTYIRVFLQADLIDSLIDLFDTDPSLDFGDFEQSYIGINVDINNYLYAALSSATAEQIGFADTRFAIEDTGADGNGMYYVSSAGYFELRSDMTAQEIENYENEGGHYYNITPIETYLNADGEFVLASEAGNTDWLRAERYDAAGAATAGNAALEGTYKFYVAADGGYSELDVDGGNIYVVYPSDEQKPFVEANIYLWNHNISLGINMPTTSGAEYSYENVGEGYGDYDAVELAIYTPDSTINASDDGGDYLYYRGEYYPITLGALYTYDDAGARQPVSSWDEFAQNPYSGDYYLHVSVEGEGFGNYVVIEAGHVYEREVYKTVYRYVGQGNGSYKRLATTSLISVPEFHVNFDSDVENYDTLEDSYYVDGTGSLVAGIAPEDADKVFDKSDVHFVYDEATGTFMSVKDYLAANSLDSLPTGTRVYDSEYINYLDTGDLYYLNVVIRGEVFLGQHVEYLTADEWASANLGELPADAYVLVRGHYVPFDVNNTTHANLTKYYAYANSSSAVSEVLGAILGDMDALFTVADGYSARLPFEIRATVKLDYANETDYDSLYVAGLELAVDVWRTEASDGTLSHVLGLYYMSDVWNIGDNDITNDVINSSALYLDLTWLLGEGAKFKVDLSAYPLEDLLNDNIDLGSIFGGGSDEAITAADDSDLGDASKATALLNVFSRSIALKASAGLIKLLIGLIAPDMSATLEEMLPNMSIFAQIDAAPYDLTIGATLYDEEGTGLLDLGLTLNLFNTDDASEGLQLSFGSLDDYAALSAAQLAAKSKDYIYYYGLFTRDDDAEGDDYYIKDGTEKGYVHITDATEEQIAAAGNAKFVFNDEPAYELFVSSAARRSYPETERYTAIPAGYIELRNADDYTWVKNSASGTQLYYYYYSFSSSGSGRAAMQSVNSTEIPGMADISFIDYGITGQNVGYAKLYINYANLSAENRAKALEYFGLTEEEVMSEGRYTPDSQGAHKQTTIFTDYKTLLSLNLGELIAGIGGSDEGTDGTSAILDMLVNGLQDAELETLEIGGTLSLDLTFRDVLNWTRQMSRLMTTDSSADTYFEMLLASMAMNSAEFVSAIGLDITLALQIRLDGLIAMLPDLLGGGEIDTAALLGALLGGASIYLEIAIDTNFFGDKIDGADPIRVWLLVDENLGADIYIDTADLGTVIGSVGEGMGNFFGKLKLEGMLNLGELLSGLTGGDGASEAVTAADNSFIIDIGDATTGLIPEDIWGVLDLLIGQALFAGDMISVGITENLLAGLIEALVPEFPEEDIELLPTFTVTSGADTSGVNLLFGDGSLALQLQLGIKGGFDDYAPLDEVVEVIEQLGSASVYGIDDINAYLGDITLTDGDEVVISTEDYALAVYASPEEAWLGDRYTLSGFNEEGHPEFTLADNAYANAFKESADGLYGVLAEADESYQGVTGGQVTTGTFVTYEAGTYMLVSRIEKLTGEDYTGTRYSFDEDAVTGEYIKLGDVTIALELGDLGLTLNEEFSAPLDDEGYTDVMKSSLRLSTSVDVGFYGKTGAGIDLGSIADLIFGIDALKSALGVELTNNSLDVNITGDLGNADAPYFNIRLDAWFDLGTGKLQVKLEVGRYDYNNGGVLDTMLAVSLADDTLYADLSGLLGEGVQGRITGLGIEALLAEALGGLTGAGAQNAEATTATIADTAGMTLHEYAYIAAMINPGYFSLQLTLAAVEAIIAKVGADNPDLDLNDIELPDLGDIMIESNGSEEGGAWLSLNAKLSEDFGASIDIHRVYLGTEPIYSTTSGLTGTEGMTADEKFADYALLYDVASGALNPDLNISASASAEISMTSEGLNPGDEGYEDSLAGWVIDLVTGLLGSTSIFVTPYDIGAEADYNKYGGPIYVLGDDGVTYVEKGKVASGGNGYYELKDDGTYADQVTTWSAGGYSQYYRTTIVEATFAANDINLTIDLEADLNIGAIVTYGIGGILFSDLRVSVGLGSPFNSTILEVYYLGSSRLSDAANNNIYTLVEDVETGNLGAFNDAIYIDASGLGLGKIKFQGLAGVLGANIGQIYDNDALSADAGSAADETDTGAEEGTASEGESLPSASVSLGINIAENYLGIGIDRNLIQTVFGLLGDSLGGISLPDVQSLNLGLTFGEVGLSSIAIDAELDAAGTGAHIALSDLEVSLDPFVDVDSLINEVKTGYGGLTYSQTAGTMTLLQNILDGLNANLSLTVDKRGESIVQSTTSWGNAIWPFGIGADFVGVKTNFRSSVTAVSTSGLFNVAANGGPLSGDVAAFSDFMLKLDVTAKHPHIDTTMRGVDTVDLDVYFGNNNLWINDIGIDLGAAGDLIGVFASNLLNWINIGNFISPETGTLFSFAYSDADNSAWSTNNPVATTASDDNVAKTSADWAYGFDNDDLSDAAVWTSPSAETNDDETYKLNGDTSEYSYPLNLTGLVEKVTVNLFNGEGYQPYLADMVGTSLGAGLDASLISIKIELNKYAYNELLVFLYTTILSLMHYGIDMNSYGVNYFSYLGGNMWEAEGVHLARHQGSDKRYVISNLFKELDSIAYMDNLSEQQKTERRVQLLDPYVRSLPIGLLQWLLYDALSSQANGIISDNAAAIGYLTGSALGDLTLVIANILPPFADMDANAVNPSLNLYIDLAPESTFYGESADKEIVPGIQSIELMVNAEKYGDGRNLRQSYTDADGAIAYRYGEIYYVMEEDAELQTMVDAYVLAINPSNLSAAADDLAYTNKGLVSFLEADHLNSLSFSSGTQLTSDQLTQLRDGNTYITVSDIGSKVAQLHGISSAEGNLNASFLTSNLPTSANVQLVSPNNPHDVTVIWDASAIDLSAPHSFVDEDGNSYCDNCGLEKGDVTLGAHGTQRLAGFVYGYALNLVVAKIPVYVTNDFTATEVSPVGSDLSFSIDMSSAGNVKLPDLVKIKFTSEGATSGTKESYIFGTQRFDDAGNAQYAVLRNAGGNYQFKVTDANGNVTYSYHALDTSSTETTTYELALYPAYVAYTDPGNTVTSEEVTYYVIESASVNNMPVGTIAWDLSEFYYGWDGGNVTLGFTYQWGYSAEQTASVSVPVTGVLIEDDDSLIFRGDTAPVYGSEGGFTFSDWDALQDAAGALGDDWAAQLKAYITGFNTLSGTYIAASGYGNSFQKAIDWDLSAIDSLNVTPGSAFTVQVTMFVGTGVDGYNIWRQYNGDALSYGMMGDVAVYDDAARAWRIATGVADHNIIRQQLESQGYAVVAQPVTVTITVGAQEGFVPSGSTGGGTDEGGEQGGEITTESVDTFAFSDGSSTSVTADGVQTYEITSSAQLYGMMPKSGVIVDGDTGRTRKAAFDWNGFAYDTSASVNVALLTATSGSTREETDVIVTLADNADVNAGVEALEATAGYVTGIVDASMRAMVIDPFEYSTFAAYLEAKGYENGDEITVYTTDSPSVPVRATVVAWSDTFENSSAMPLAGGRYDDHCIIVEIGGVQYSVNVPVIVLERNIAASELLLNEGFELVNEYNRLNSTIRRYVGEDQVVEVTYSRETYLPTAITVYNLYAFADDNPFTGKIRITFENGGEQVSYPFDYVSAQIKDGNAYTEQYESVDGIEHPVSASSTDARIYNYTVAGGIQTGTVTVTFNAVRITQNNMDSAVAYGDLGGTAAGYQPFAPYDNMTLAGGGNILPTPYGTQGSNLSSGITFYVDGRFVAAAGFDIADYPGYTVLADGGVKREYVRGSGTSYTLVTDETTDATYYFIYGAADTLEADELTWDHSGISYNYNGGVRRTSASVNANGITGTVTVPVRIVSGRIANITALYFDEAGQDGSLATGNTLTVDPFDGINLTELAAEGSEHYKYFPSSVDAVTTDGSVITGLGVTWSNLGSIRNTYRGGVYSARLTVPAVTSEDGATSYVAAQGFTADGFVTVKNREAVDGTLTVGNAALPTDGYADNGSVPSVYIDPYEFDLSAFRTEVEQITSVTVNIKDDDSESGVIQTTFTADGQDGYTLVWSFAGMAVNYLGGRVALIAQLTGPDGSTQNYEIDYLVTRKLVSNIAGTKGGTWSSAVNTTIGSELGRTIASNGGGTYVIDPFDPSTQSLPTGWNVTFALFNPTLDENGVVTSWTDAGTEEQSYGYITTIMPSTAALTAENAANGLSDAGEATMQIDGGQRIRIPVSITGSTATGTDIPGRNGNILTSRVSGTNGDVNVVWYGRVRVGYNNGYNEAEYWVTLTDPNGSGVVIEGIEGRTVEYYLTAYVGAVINAAGKVLDSNDGVPAGTASTQVSFSVSGTTITDIGWADPLP